MLKVTMYDTSGSEAGKINLNEKVFGRDYNEALIHQVVVAQLANKRQGTKSTLTRSEVRGGGAKPWRQKGTGRARQGTIRAPQWKSGGVVFAPKPRDFSQKINRAAKREALKSVLSEKVRSKEIKVLKELKLKEAKTKEVAAVLKALELNSSTLLVVADNDPMVVRAARNIKDLKTTNTNMLNVYDVVACKNLLITSDAVKQIEEMHNE